MILADCIILLVGGFIVGALVVAIAFAHEMRANEARNEARQECEEPRQWFVRYSYRRTHFNNYAPPTQWYSTYDIIECEDTNELKASALYSRLHKDLLFPNSKDDVEIRIIDVHEL